MYVIRKIAILLALAIAGSGSLPLVVHDLYCHHDLVVTSNSTGQSSETSVASCGCVHSCLSPKSSEADSHKHALQDPVASAGHEDCLVCFQLSQAIFATVTTSLVSAFPLCVNADDDYQNLDLPTVESSYPPRGPPAV